MKAAQSQRIVLSFLLWMLAQHLVSAGTNEAGLAFLKENKEKEGVVELPSGLQYKVLKKGRGVDHPMANAPCMTNYEGRLINGDIFDANDGIKFAPNQVIRGWTEAMQLMVVGDKWELYIPSELAYGDRGSPPKIGGGEVLIFQMEIISIEGNTVPALKCTLEDAETTCNEKEVAYIAKVEPKGPSYFGTEVKRLESILSGPMKDNLREWTRRRKHILEQMVQASGEL